VSLCLVTDFEHVPEQITLDGGETIRIIRAERFRDFRAALAAVDGIVVNGTVPVIFKLVVYFLLCPWKRKPIIAVDLVLREPRSARQKIVAAVKRLLLFRVDHFIHYFNDLSGYQKHYGIGPDRSSYVPFKVNIWGVDTSTLPKDDMYIFTMGISQRDYATFIEAVSLLRHPAAIPQFSFSRFEDRAADFVWTEDNLPANLQLLPDTGSDEDLIRHLARAKVVVIPTLKSSLCASGISTYLDAMYLGKCVIVSEGPGASELLEAGQAILVERNNPAALRQAMETAWENTELRQQVAEAGQRYAMSLGGEQDLLKRVFQATARLIQR